MALNNKENKDIFGLKALIPPTADGTQKEIEIKKENKEAQNVSNKQPVVKKETVSKTPTKKKVKEDNFFTVRIKFYDEDDKGFLKYYGGNLGFSQEEFLNFIITKNVKDKKKIDFKDEDHELFRTGKLTLQTTARLSENIKTDLLKESSNHRLSQEQYLGYIVRKERFETPGWY